MRESDKRYMFYTTSSQIGLYSPKLRSEIIFQGYTPISHWRTNEAVQNRWNRKCTLPKREEEYPISMSEVEAWMNLRGGIEGAKPSPPSCFRSFSISYNAFDGPLRKKMAAECPLSSISRPLVRDRDTFPRHLLLNMARFRLWWLIRQLLGFITSLCGFPCGTIFAIFRGKPNQSTSLGTSLRLTRLLRN